MTLRLGFTLVELLVAVSILTILAFVLIPQIRMVNRERGIREAARIVGSVFADASIRARANGFAAVGIRRNANFFRKVNSLSGVNDIYYAGSTLYLLKLLPPYTGNDETSRAIIPSPIPTPPPPSGSFFVDIPAPFDPRLRAEIQTGCKIQLGGLSSALSIIDVLDLGAGLLRLTVVLPQHLPGFPQGTPLPFKVIRLATRVANSEVVIPSGYYINLNYSGPTTAQTPNVSEWENHPTDISPATWTYLSEDRGTTDINNNEIIITFGPNGGIDRIYPNGEGDGGKQPISSLNLCVCSDEVGNTFDPAADNLPRSVAANGKDLLNQEDVIWVSINNQNGGVFVSPIAAVGTTVSNPDAIQPQRILQSQSFRLVGQAAGQ
jgi:prepilin-type N-terminal cleavage/methylation domain-containing protein